ncbi:MarR family transcriptional regulator [Rhodococcus daqingensis]|uniref:MarR family transcriptional regulator n=1 Tax=Rhodococcus daqingensis TaxID=2479363 RepID=A0ABW2S406_9NOCA
MAHTTELDDSTLARLPIGQWTDAAHTEVIAFIRRSLAARGLTQPQYWIIRNLHPEDLATAEEAESGLTVAELSERMSSYLLPQDEPEPDAADLVARGLLTRDAAGRLRLAEPGRLAHAQVKEQLPGLRGEIHAGIDDADYVTTVKVLRRMILNVGGAEALARYPV